MMDRVTIRSVRRGTLGIGRPTRTTTCVLLAVLLTGWCWRQSAAAAPKERKGRRAAAENSKPATDESAKTAEKEKSGAKAKGKRSRPSRTGQADSHRLEADDLRYMPDDCSLLGWIDVEGLRQSITFVDVTAVFVDHWEAVKAPTGHPLAELERAVLGIKRVLESDELRLVVVFHFKEPAEGPGKKPDPELAFLWRKEKVGRFTIFVEDGSKPWAYCNVDAETMIAGTPELVRAVLKRDAPAKLPEKLDAAFSRLEPTSDIACAILPKDWITPEREASLGVAAELVRGIEGVNIEAALDADLDLRLAAVCCDEETAYQLKGIATTIWALVQASNRDADATTRAILQSARLRVRDRTFAFELSVPASCLENLIERGEDSLSISLSGKDSSTIEPSLPDFAVEPADSGEWSETVRPLVDGPAEPSGSPNESYPYYSVTGPREFLNPEESSADAPGPRECPSTPITGYGTAGYASPADDNPYGSSVTRYRPLIEQAVGRLLARHSQGIQQASVNAGSPGPMRVCFIGVENKSAEELGDFKDQIYELIDTKVVQSGVYKMISGRYVDAGLRQSRLRPDELLIPANTRTFAAVMEQMQQPFDFLLYAKITSGTTTTNKDYQRDYLLTLEMVDMRDGSYDKESALFRKGDNTYGSSITPYGATAPPLALWRPVPEVPQRAALELDEVIELSQAGVDEEVILKHLRGGRLFTPLTTDDLILLTEKGVGANVILALQDLPARTPRDNTHGQARGELLTPEGSRLGFEDVFPTDAEVLFAAPEGMIVEWDVSECGAAPASKDMPVRQTLEIEPESARAKEFLVYTPISIRFTEEEIDRAVDGESVTKVIYLPDKERGKLAMGGTQTLVSTRMDPGIDPVAEAERRGTVLAVVRVANKDLGRDGPEPAYYSTIYSDFDKLLERDSSNSEYQRNLGQGRGLERGGRFDEARRVYERLVRESPDRYEAHHRLGVVTDFQGRHRDAEPHYRQALRLHPGDPEILNDLGYCLFLQGKLAEAEKLLRQALSLSPENPRWRNNLAIVYGHQRRYEESLEQFRQTGTEAEAQYNLASIYASHDDWDSAKACLHRALAADPGFERASKMLARLTRDDPKTDDGSSRQEGLQQEEPSPHSDAPEPIEKQTYTRERLRDLLDKWERMWFLDQPDHTTPYRTHGGLI